MPDYYNPFNTVLSSAEQKVNASYIYGYLTPLGFTVNAIAAMLGNWQSESTINPNRVQTRGISRWPNWGDYGFGLPQFTPWYTAQDTQGNWINPASYHGTNSPTYGYWAEQKGYTVTADGTGTIGKMEPQLDFMAQGLGGWKTTTSYYTMSFSTFKTSTWGADELARVYYRNFERSLASSYGSRPSNALKWYEFLSGVTPTPTPTTEKKKNFLIMAYGSGLFK